MLRILGVNLPEEKRIEYALTYIKGIGLFSSRKILDETGIDLNKRAKDIGGIIRWQYSNIMRWTAAVRKRLGRSKL